MLHPNANDVERMLERMRVPDALALLAAKNDDPWLDRLLRDGGPQPIDKGIYWVVLASDMIYPVRVFLASRNGERHAVWLTIEPDDGYAYAVFVRPGDHVNDWQAGVRGRDALLRARDVPADEHL